MAAVGLMSFCDHTCVATVMEFGDFSHMTSFLPDVMAMRHRNNFTRYLVEQDLRQLKIDNGLHLWIPRVP